ncbi:MAG TPA: Gfo/Idh/MocA family oxidoreductase [Vicinamibacterales bacterium]|nr:Gfo/Idh/MocA family oxidoreductase [Vicinamibacterales bacterium]
MNDKSRREFLESSVTTLAVAALGTSTRAEQPAPRASRIRFAAVGLNHGHIYGQVDAVQRGGGELVAFFAREPDLAASFAKRFPGVRQARSEQEILDDASIQLVVSAAIPNERAPLGVRVMRHGKDFMSDKPAATTLAQLEEVRRVQQDTRRIYSVLIERHEHRATAKAVQLVRDGAIGRVLQTLSTGPHRMNPNARPSWFFERERYGGILCDVASHHIDQFLVFTGSAQADIVAAQVGNLHHPKYPELEDFGDVMLRSDRGTGYIRVDWFTPAGLSTYGDGRLTILGTDGYIEVRKTIDIAGRPGGNHLFIVDQKAPRYIDCSDVPLPYGERLVDDVLNRTETANPQVQTFLAMEVALRAQEAAQRLTDAAGGRTQATLPAPGARIRA